MAAVPDILAKHSTQIYNVPERAILDSFKSDYINTATAPARKQLFLSRIWPSMYRYWRDKDGDLTRAEWSVRAKILSKWIWNNWRLAYRGTTTKSLISVKRSDVVWRTRKQEVMEEVARILNVTEATTQTEKFFTTRSRTVRHIMERMTDEEKELLEKQVQDIEENGYSEEQRQAYGPFFHPQAWFSPKETHRFAEKNCTRRLDNAARAHWLEMGMLTLSVVCYRRTDGKLCVEIHETASNLAKVSDRCFEDEQEGKAREIKRVWLEYVRNIWEEKHGEPAPNGVPDPYELGKSSEGFPMFPSNFTVEKLKKKHAEKLVREYLKQNYWLATGEDNSNVPYTEIQQSAESRRRFIEDIYLPTGLIMRDPHNMKLEQLQELLQFLFERQGTQEGVKVFRFCAVKAGRKGSEIVPTAYPDERTGDRAIPTRKKAKRSKARQKQPTTVTTHAVDGARLANSDAANPPAGSRVCQWNNVNMFVFTPEPSDRGSTITASDAHGPDDTANADFDMFAAPAGNGIGDGNIATQSAANADLPMGSPDPDLPMGGPTPERRNSTTIAANQAPNVEIDGQTPEGGTSNTSQDVEMSGPAPEHGTADTEMDGTYDIPRLERLTPERSQDIVPDPDVPYNQTVPMPRVPDIPPHAPEIRAMPAIQGKRSKNTADALAAKEAKVLTEKRKRIPKVRES